MQMRRPPHSSGPQILLRPGPSERTVNIIVAAPDGVSSGTYAVTIRKGAAQDEDVRLSSLQVCEQASLRPRTARIRAFLPYGSAPVPLPPGGFGLLNASCHSTKHRLPT